VTGTAISPSDIASAVKSLFTGDSGNTIATLLNGVGIPPEQIVAALPGIGENVGQIAQDISGFVSDPSNAGTDIVNGLKGLGLVGGGPTPEQEATALAAAYNISQDEALQIIDSSA
jgi:hypothetical protein